jgi:hypothetical protein
MIFGLLKLFLFEQMCWLDTFLNCNLIGLSLFFSFFIWLAQILLTFLSVSKVQAKIYQELYITTVKIGNNDQLWYSIILCHIIKKQVLFQEIIPDEHVFRCCREPQGWDHHREQGWTSRRWPTALTRSPHKFRFFGKIDRQRKPTELKCHPLLFNW